MLRFCLKNLSLIAMFCLLVGVNAAAAPAWHIAKGRLTTPWDKNVSPTHAWVHYPRPQMIRNQWKNLNGLWRYSIVGKHAPAPHAYHGRILVPFPVQSALSGVAKNMGAGQQIWYQRTFTLPAAWEHQQILLHFGAANWRTRVWVNGHKEGSHKGGYDAFTFNITKELKPTGKQLITVSVWNPVDKGEQPIGKQRLHPGGIFYTACSGIWQTVWLEPVPAVYIKSMRIVPHVDQGNVTVTVRAAGGTATVEVLNGDQPVGQTIGKAGRPLVVAIPHAKLWWPNKPFLYNLDITLKSNGKTDHVKSYFGMRKISIGPDRHGVLRILLNNKFVFERGLLDQGYWPDGIYLAPTDKALRFDIQESKALGFNMCRKHQKVEPARWYYWCDKLGFLVWQDMPAAFYSKKGPSAKVEAQYRLELTRMIQQHENDTCIIGWTPFNEGWGQVDTHAVVALIHRLDPSRLIDDASGWVDKGVGNIRDTHHYPTPWCRLPGKHRASIDGEFGGLGLPVRGHLWQKKFFQYQGFKTPQAELVRFQQLWREVWAMEKDPGVTTATPGVAKSPWWAKGRGMSGAVYTQTTDSEGEINGMMTYDRRHIKMPVKAVNAAVRNRKE